MAEFVEVPEKELKRRNTNGVEVCFRREAAVFFGSGTAESQFPLPPAVPLSLEEGARITRAIRLGYARAFRVSGAHGPAYMPYEKGVKLEFGNAETVLVPAQFLCANFVYPGPGTYELVDGEYTLTGIFEVPFKVISVPLEKGIRLPVGGEKGLSAGMSLPPFPPGDGAVHQPVFARA
jgi:hypothetical protein